MSDAGIVGFMTGRQLAPFLSKIERQGKDHCLAEWIIEGLQDRGLIDHQDRLTEDGKKILDKHRNSA